MKNLKKSLTGLPKFLFTQEVLSLIDELDLVPIRKDKSSASSKKSHKRVLLRNVR